MSRKRKPSVQICVKRFWGRCFFCGEPDYDLLDAHRIVPGEAGGTYHWDNILPSCAKCHRKGHAGRIVVHGRHLSTAGVHVIHYTEDGLEQWEREDRWLNPR